MIDKKAFKKTIAEALEGNGFVKKGQSWYYDGKDVLIVFNLQKSDWDELYYINLGFWLNAFGKSTFPQHNHCHLDFRAESLFPDKRDLLLASCSLVKSNDALLKDLSSFLADRLVPFLLECTDEVKLRELMSQGKLRQGLVLSNARDYLSS